MRWPSFEATSVYWTPNSQALAVARDSEIAIVGVDGTLIKKVPLPGHGALRFGWSANGQWFAFSASVQTFVVSADGESLLEPEPMVSNNLGVWSSQGATLAMKAPDGLGLWSPSASFVNVPVQLTYPVPAFEDGGWLDSVSWSPDGSRFHYEQAQRAGAVDHTSLIDPSSGAELARFTRARASWNASGSHLLLSCRAGSGPDTCWGSKANDARSYVVVNSDGGEPTPIVEASNDGGWLPEGDHIAAGTPSRVLISRRDGSQQYSLPIVNGRLVLPTALW